jgi:hypothetical protein
MENASPPFAPNSASPCGRASTSMLDDIASTITYPNPAQQSFAQRPEPRMITIGPWDSTAIP